MLRQAPRIATRLKAATTRPIIPPRRLLSTAPPSQTSRSWKNGAARWGIAVGSIYWYSTSNLFAEEAAFPVSQPLSPTEETNLPTVDAITESRAQQRRKESEQQAQHSNESDASATDTPNANSPAAELEEEASSQGAFNEETGEINWDCPCLGGMAHGTCGEEFKAAFSCFVYSTDEPKGMNCVDKFQGMQDCFRAHPEEYGEELEREEEDAKTEAELEMREKNGEAGVVQEGEGVHAPASIAEEGARNQERQSSSSTADGKIDAKLNEATQSKVGDDSKQNSAVGESQSIEGKDPSERAQKAKAQVDNHHPEPTSESDSLVPKASHDAR